MLLFYLVSNSLLYYFQKTRKTSELASKKKLLKFYYKQTIIMKKQLPNRKALSQFFYILSIMLLFANAVLAQKTIMNETFGTIAINSPYTGGTSTVPASPNQITYTKTTTAATPGIASVAISASNGYLSLTAGTSGKTYLTAPLPTFNFVSILKNNPFPITWTFNMRLNRSTNSAGLASTQATNYTAAEVLVASSSDLLGTSTKGYAVSLSVGSTINAVVQQKIELSSFTQGLGSSVSVIALPEFPKSEDYVSVKVTYTPSTDMWSLAVKSNGATAFSDPSTDTFSSTASITNTVNTSETMTHFGYFYGHMYGGNGTISSAVFKNDNYKMVLESPFVALPTVEPRQAFHNSPAPTVANLVAGGTVGATLKWYSVLGVTALTSNTSITSGTYYVTQTIGSDESDVVSTQVFVGDTALKTLPLHESFIDYTVGDKLILMKNGASTGVSTNQGTGLGSWSMSNSSNITDDVTIVTSPTWTTTVIPARLAADKAITFVGSGIDPELKFTDTTSGSLYSSFLFTAADVTTIVTAQAAADADAGSAVTLPSGIDPAKSTPTGFYGFANETDPTSYASDVFFRKVIGDAASTTANKFNIGLSKTNNSAECVWSDTEFEFGTQHLIVISYENIGDATATNQVANLWIDPASTTQPSATLTQSAPLTSVTRSNLDRIKILQASSSSTPTLVIDEIRVANNWGQALGGPSTLGVAKLDLSSLKVYPNPVTNGKLFISSANAVEKQVAIYSILGQKVLDTKTTNNTEINVSKLAKGTYILKISEEGVSNTKKLIIQ